MGFGSGLISFSGVKNFISNNTKRKKSAPEPEIKKNINVKNDDEELDYLNDHYSSKLSFGGTSQTNLTPLNTYTIYLNDSCTIEVTATRQGSVVANVLKLALDKIKANEDPSEYCLVEHIEQEKTILKQDSINSINNNNTINRTSYPCGMQKKLSVVRTTRILEPNENLFLLTHVWNQLRNEGKDGFKNVRIILTKMSLKPEAFYKPKRASLLKHRFSLQPKPSTGFTLIETLKQTNNRNSIKPDLIGKLPSPLLNDPVLATKTLSRNRNKSSMNRLVRQKSFDESNEMIDQAASANTKQSPQFLKILNRSHLDDNMYPKQPINNYELVREKSEENLPSFKSSQTAISSVTNNVQKSNNLVNNSSDDEETSDTYETFREKKPKTYSLTSSNKTTDETDNTNELNSAKEEKEDLNNRENEAKKTAEFNDYSNDNDDYDDLNENYDYHDDYSREDDYKFIGKAPLASDSILSSNDSSSLSNKKDDSSEKLKETQRYSAGIQRQSTLHRLFKSKLK